MLKTLHPITSNFCELNVLFCSSICGFLIGFTNNIFRFYNLTFFQPFHNSIFFLYIFVFKMFLRVLNNLLYKLMTFTKLHVSYMILPFNMLKIVFERCSTNLTKKALRFSLINLLNKITMYFKIHVLINFLNFALKFFLGLFSNIYLTNDLISV